MVEAFWQCREPVGVFDLERQQHGNGIVPSLPIVLSLLDQLYEVRRRMRELGDALGQTAPEDVRHAVARHLADCNDGQ